MYIYRRQTSKVSTVRQSSYRWTHWVRVYIKLCYEKKALQASACKYSPWKIWILSFLSLSLSLSISQLIKAWSGRVSAFDWMFSLLLNLLMYMCVHNSEKYVSVLIIANISINLFNYRCDFILFVCLGVLFALFRFFVQGTFLEKWKPQNNTCPGRRIVFCKSIKILLSA